MKNISLGNGLFKVERNRYEKKRDFNLGPLTKDQQWKLLRESIRDLSRAGRDRDLERIKNSLGEVKQIVKGLEG